MQKSRKRKSQWIVNQRTATPSPVLFHEIVNKDENGEVVLPILDKSLFVNSTEQPVSNLDLFVCAICQGVVRFACALDCGHLFCWSCLKNWTLIQRIGAEEARDNLNSYTGCPTCRQPIISLKRNCAIDLLLGTAILKCPFATAQTVSQTVSQTESETVSETHQSGCAWTGMMGYRANVLQTHLAQCPLRTVSCGQCKLQIQASTRAVHAEQCAKREILCIYCQEQILNTEFATHQREFIDPSSKEIRLACINFQFCPNLCLDTRPPSSFSLKRLKQEDEDLTEFESEAREDTDHQQSETNDLTESESESDHSETQDHDNPITPHATTILRKSLLADHLELQCLLQPIKCTFQRCPIECRRQDLKQHLIDAANDHLLGIQDWILDILDLQSRSTTSNRLITAPQNRMGTESITAPTRQSQIENPVENQAPPHPLTQLLQNVSRTRTRQCEVNVDSILGLTDIDLSLDTMTDNRQFNGCIRAVFSAQCSLQGNLYKITANCTVTENSGLRLNGIYMRAASTGLDRLPVAAEILMVCLAPSLFRIDQFDSNRWTCLARRKLQLLNIWRLNPERRVLIRFIENLSDEEILARFLSLTFDYRIRLKLKLMS